LLLIGVISPLLYQPPESVIIPGRRRVDLNAGALVRRAARIVYAVLGLRAWTLLARFARKRTIQ